METVAARPRVAEQEPQDALVVVEPATEAVLVTDARGEIATVAEVFRYYAGAPEQVLGDTVPIAGGLAITVREPLGVVALITPWNFPLAIAAWKVAPALAAGNTVVLKPAELTSLTALRLAELALEAGLPEGVLTVVPGLGPIAGRRLVEHPTIAEIGFTGSTAVGGAIAATAGSRSQARHPRARRQVGQRRVRRRELRAGGRNGSGSGVRQRRPGLLSPLADPHGAHRARRVPVAAAPAVRRLPVGDPLDDATAIGPLISAERRDVAARYFDEDAVVIPGTASEGRGFWLAPTVMSSLPPTHPAVHEEIFGSVAVVPPFDDEAEAVQLANDTIYGLSGSVWTRDGAKALRVARASTPGTSRSTRTRQCVSRRRSAGSSSPGSGESSVRTRSSTTPSSKPSRTRRAERYRAGGHPWQ